MSNLQKSRDVLVFSGMTSTSEVIKTTATTWEELQRDLLQKTQLSSFDKLKCVIGESKLTLESPNAQLPDGNFTLITMVKKTKSGFDCNEYSYRELRAAIKNAIFEGDAEKTYFSIGRKNWTQLSTAEMIKKLNDLYNKKTVEKPKKVKTKKSKKIKKSKKVEKLEEKKKTDAIVELTIDEYLEGVVDIIRTVQDKIEQKEKMYNESKKPLLKQEDAYDVFKSLKNDLNDVSY